MVWRLALRAGVIAGAVWTALALSPARLFIIDWTRGRATRVAILPDPSWVLASLVLALGLLVGVAVVWRRRGGSVEALARRCTPLAALAVLAVPYLPAAGDWLPGLTVFAGPYRWLVIAAAVVAVLWPLAVPALRALEGAASRDPRWLVVLGLAVIGATGLWHSSLHGLGGDEPHYLVIAESLRRDGDLDIENNHAQRDYARFVDHDIPPDFRQRGVDGAIYSIHAPGLALLVLPAYSIGGVAGAKLFLALIAALAGLAVYRLARDLTSPGVALATWAAVLLTTPFFLQGTLIFPEVPAAAIVAWSLWWLRRPDDTRVGTWLGRGLALACLPWLHTKFSVLLAGLAVALATGLLTRRRWREVSALSVPIALSIGGWLLSFSVMYGVADPTIAYGAGIARTSELAWANVPRGCLGYLFDQEYGLLPYAPVYLLCLAGVAPLLRCRDARTVALSAMFTAVLFIVATTRYYMWWGGWSVPARFLVPILPLLAPLLAAGLRAAATAASGRAVAAATLGASLLATLVLAGWPDRLLMFNDRDGTGKLLAWLQGPAGFTTVWPSLVGPEWAAQLPRALAVGAAIVFGLAAMWTVGRRRREPSDAGPLAVLLIVATTVGLTLSTRPLLDRAATTALMRDSQMRLLREWPAGRMADLSSGVMVPASSLLTRMRIPLSSGASGTPDDPARWLGPWQLPPGTYRLRVWLAPGTAEPGEFVASFHGLAGVAARVPSSAAKPLVLPITLPPGIDMPPIWLGVTNPALATHVIQVDLEARDIAPRTAPEPPRARAVDGLPDQPGTYVAYLDDNAFPEDGSFWTRGGAAANVMVIAPPGRTLRLHVETGDAAGVMDLVVDGRATRVALPAHGSTSIDVPLSDSAGGTLLQVGFSGGFRPSDRGAADTRWLGVRILPRLR